MLEGKVQLPPDARRGGCEPALPIQRRGDPRLTDPPRAIVYLDGVFPAKVEQKGQPLLQMTRKNISFTGFIASSSAPRSSPNLDDTYHNVFFLSKTKRFDLSRYRKSETRGPFCLISRGS